MAFNIASATIDLSLKGLGGVTSGLKKLGSMLGTVLKRALQAVAAAAAAALAALSKLTFDAFGDIDELAKTADRLGITTEALAGLQHAGELTGVAINTMNMALQRMIRRVAEAGAGTGEAKDAIAELGLNAQELAAMSPDQQFVKIAGAMKDVGTQSDRVRLAFKLFDSEGVRLVNTLAMGEAGLRAAMFEARQLGVAVSRLDAAKVEAANDAMLRIGQALKGVGRTLAIQLAPVIERMAPKVTMLILKFREWSRAATVGALSVAVEFAKLVDVVRNTMANLSEFVGKRWGNVFGVAIETLKNMGKAIDNFMAGRNLLSGIIRPELESFEFVPLFDESEMTAKLKRALKAARAEALAVAGTAGDGAAQGAAQGGDEGTAGLTGALTDVAASFRATQERLLKGDGSSDPQKQAAQLLKELKKPAEETATNTRNVVREMVELSNALRARRLEMGQ